MNNRAWVVLVVVSLTGGCSGKSQPSSTERGAATAPAAPAAPAARIGPGDWIAYNGSLGGDRYSPLKQINTSNVAQLRQACAFDTPDIVSFQSGIVAVGGVLYFTAFNNTYAIDATTCQQKWKQTRAEPETFLHVNRGVGYLAGKVFRGTGDAHVLALDASNGSVLWDATIGDAKKGESVPMAPIAWSGLVFVGNAGGDSFNVSGRIYALDAATGRTVWQFNTIPESGPERATWRKASAENPPGGGATWTSYALDEASGLLYVSTGNPAPEFVAELHPGENLYSNSVLAIDAKSGRLVAYVQPIKRDFHDWDVSAAPALITTKSGRRFVAAAAKDGYVYGIERTATSHLGERGPGGTTLVVRSKGLATTRANAETPLSSARMTRFCPGTQGGVEWNGPTFHRELGLVYVNAIDWCTSVKLQPLDALKGTLGMPWSGMDDPENPFGKMDPTDRWKGWVTALDPESGAIKWKVQTPKPMVAGITATAGGLVFTGNLDGEVLAYDAQTGKAVWQSATGKALGGGVISYEVGGKQFVAAAAGLNSKIWPVTGGPARVVVYGLP
jgi:alcohol dehydrogenase (cytochrome c)